MTAHASVSSDLLSTVAAKARAAGVFAGVEITGSMVQCAALNCPEPAFYRLAYEGGRWWVSFVTPARYLSQSIEADLVHTGDKLHDLLNEEIVALDGAGTCSNMEHFRSPDKLYTFRAALPTGADAQVAARWLLALEQAFRPLGDVSAGGEDE
jgi:hypothetical protein